MKQKKKSFFVISFLKYFICLRIETKRKTVLICLFALLSLYILLQLSQVNNLTVAKYFPGNHSIALVIAHPDDEAIFFSPTLLYLSKIKHFQMHVLCVTNGNFYGLGEVRSKELFRSCYEYGLEKEQVYLLNDDMFYDHPSIRWNNISMLAKKLELILEERSIDTVLSFGPYGCSGHPNHRDVHLTVRTLTSYRRFFMTDVCFLRYYGGIFEVIYTYFLSSEYKAFFLSWDVLKTFKAMSSHLSQFRYHWILVRYVLINDWTVYDINARVGNELPAY
nr:N-acetylglucosaminyl-phosphatidylinositol de-N-acetylase [Hydra vulgaris]